MRESLTIFAIALILLLSALLVGPYLVDWNGQRDWLAAKLSHAVGAEVRIAGPIDVKLLPRPIFRASDVSIAGTTPRAPRFSAERLDAELSLNGLLQGTIEFVDARLSAPRFELTIRHDGSVVAPAVSADKADRIQFTHLEIERGSLAVLDEAGQETAVVTGIGAEGQADTLFGPVKLDGTAETADGPVIFRLNTSAYQSGRLRLHAAVDRKGAWSHADVDGMVTLADPAGPKPSLRFEGSVGASGQISVAAAASPVPWRIVSTGNTADWQGLAAPSIEIRAGVDGRALVANGSASFSQGEKPGGAARFRARQLDLDRITVPPDVAPDTPKPSARQWLDALRDGLDDSITLPFGLKLEATVDAITSGSLTLTDATGALDAEPGSLPHVAFSIAGPNASRAVLDGTVETGAVPVFKGTADLDTHDLGTAVGWIGPFFEEMPAGLDAMLQGQAGALRGTVDLSSVGLVARDTTLNWAGTGLVGTVTATAGTADKRPRVFADLKADTLDSLRWPGLHQVLALLDPLDLDVNLRSDAMTLARSDAGVAETARLTMHAAKKGSDITVDRLSVSGLDDASLEATGSLGAGGKLEAQGRATLRDVARLTTALKPILPSLPWGDLATHGTSFAPLSFDFSTNADLANDGSVSPTRISATGTAAATRFAVSFSPWKRSGSGAETEATLVVDAPDGGQVLHEFGWPGGHSLGALHLDARGQGTLADGFDSKITVTLPASSASFAGRISGSLGQGRLSLDTSDLAAVVPATPKGAGVSLATDVGWKDGAVSFRNIVGRIAGSAVTGELERPSGSSADDLGRPALTGRLAIDGASLSALVGAGAGEPQGKAVGQTGMWSTLPFGPVPPWPNADLRLHVGVLELWPGLVGRDSDAALQIRPGAITLGNLATHVLGGGVRGSLTLRRTGAGASVVGEADFDKLSVALPNLSGRMSGLLHLAGSGPSPLAIIGSLAGDGKLTLAGTTVPALAADAPLRVAAQFNGDGTDIEQGPVTDALAKALNRSPAVLGDISAPAMVAAGDLRLSNVQTMVPDAVLTSDVTLDLAALTQEVHTVVRTGGAPPDWKGDPPQVTVTWKGPLAAPVRTIDASAFVNGLAARAIGREQERIELMKDDLRERAFFARRLKQIEAEQQAAHDAALVPKPVPRPPQRPTDIRLPKPPDVGPPTLPMSIIPSPAQSDGITQLLKTLPDDPTPLSRGGQPSSSAAVPSSRNAPKPPDPSPPPGLY